MTDLASFLAKRYGEAETMAEAALDAAPASHPRYPAGGALITGAVALSMFHAVNGPAHRLRDIALKRAILDLYVRTLAATENPPLEQGAAVELYAKAYGLTVSAAGMISARDYMDAKRELAVLEPVVRLLGTEFAGHPEYKGEWAP